MAGRKRLLLFRHGQPFPRLVHEGTAGDGDAPPGKGKSVIRPGRVPEAADRLFMVETIEPGQPGCEPGRRLVICHNKGQAMRPEIEGIVGIARINAPKLKQFRPYEHVVFE